MFVGHNILFYRNSFFFSKFDNLLLTVHNKMFKVGAET